MNWPDNCQIANELESWRTLLSVEVIHPELQFISNFSGTGSLGFSFKRIGFLFSAQLHAHICSRCFLLTKKHEKQWNPLAEWNSARHLQTSWFGRILGCHRAASYSVQKQSGAAMWIQVAEGGAEIQGPQTSILCSRVCLRVFGVDVVCVCGSGLKAKTSTVWINVLSPLVWRVADCAWNWQSFRFVKIEASKTGTIFCWTISVSLVAKNFENRESISELRCDNYKLHPPPTNSKIPNKMRMNAFI